MKFASKTLPAILVSWLACACVQSTAIDTFSDEGSPSGGDADTDADGDADTDNGLPVPHCGDGVANSKGEECDGDDFLTSFTCEGQGYFTGTPTCGDDCIADHSGCHSCGDGVVQPGQGEECDLGELNDENGACRPGCVAAFCGDGVIWDDPDAGPLPEGGAEECDDGDEDDADDCNSECLPGCVAPDCGDGIVWDQGAALEECDDANGDIGDGCSPECAEEYCGDGIIGLSRRREGFETGDLSALSWSTGVEPGLAGPFAVVDSPAPQEGDYMVASASPPSGFDNSRAYLQLTADADAESEVCFWYSGVIGFFSSFVFSVDGEVALDTNSSPQGQEWTRFCAAVLPGEDHVLMWEHHIDWMDDDAVLYLDDISLPFTAEECDDGSTDAGDGCSPLCTEEG